MTPSPSNAKTIWDEFDTRRNTKEPIEREFALYAIAKRLELDMSNVDADLSGDLIGTDGPNDKGCDYVYIDPDQGQVFVIQSYISLEPPVSRDPKLNKTHQLRQAVNWLLLGDLRDMRKDTRRIAELIRHLLAEDSIINIEFWYLHNQLHDTNVDAELKSIQELTKNIIDENSPAIVATRQVTLTQLLQWQRNLDDSISIFETITIDVCNKGVLHVAEEDWEAFWFLVPATEIAKLYIKHKDDLFNHNLRKFLGWSQKTGQINKKIRDSAFKDGNNFAVYHNGVTVLTNNCDYFPDLNQIKIEGYSIINGAQTTSVLGKMGDNLDKNAILQVRFIVQRNDKVRENIKIYNNLQNPILPSDFRANDEIQEALRTEFSAKYPRINYTGGKRGPGFGYVKGKKLLNLENLSRSLVAFHGEPGIATFNKTAILNSDSLYGSVFNNELNADHCFFVACIYTAFLDWRREARERQYYEIRAEPLEGEFSYEKEALRVLFARGGLFLAIRAFAKLLEVAANSRIDAPKAIQFKRKIETIDDGVLELRPFIDLTTSHLGTFQDECGAKLKKTPNLERVIHNEFRSLNAYLRRPQYNLALRGIVNYQGSDIVHS